MQHSILATVLLSMSLSIPALAQERKEAGSDVIKPERSIMIPTAFSPNGDGINDVFKLVNIKNEKLIDFRVFNRWGTIVYNSKDMHQGWDGNYKGQAQATGVYGYAIRIMYEDGVEEIYKGTVTLIR